MSDFLDHLAAKAVAPQPAVRPVIRTVYEPAAAGGTQQPAGRLEIPQPAPIPFPTWQHPPPSPIAASLAGPPLSLETYLRQSATRSA